MSQESLAFFAVSVVVLLAGLTSAVRRRRGERRSAAVDHAVEWADRAGLLDRPRDIVDRCLGHYMSRRLTGRPTDRMARHSLPPPLSAEEVAYRIGVPGATRQPHVRPMVLSEVAPTVATPVRVLERKPVQGTLEVRDRLMRDTGVALAGLAAVALFAVAAWPTAPNGDVLGLTATPGLSAVAEPEPTPTSTSERTPTPTPEPTPTPTP